MTPNGERHALTVPASAAGARLDKWLTEAVPGVSRSRLKTLIEAGAVQVGIRIVKDAAYRLRADDAVTVAIPPLVDAPPAPQAMDLAVVYEDAALIVIDKPVGLVVHPAPGNPDRTLVNALLAHCGASLAGIGGVRRPGIVHRIDKDTSGLLVAAKTETAHAGLSAQFKAHSIERRYDAFVWGTPKPSAGAITGAIARSQSNRKKMAIVSKGRAAETRYSVVRAYAAIGAHVRCQLTTGRTHQIRVHMASRGHALIGDRVYGRNPRALGGIDAESAAFLKNFPRQALHAATLGFIHPANGQRMAFESPLPADLVTLRTVLENIA